MLVPDGSEILRYECVVPVSKNYAGKPYTILNSAGSLFEFSRLMLEKLDIRASTTY